jgi:hypothetical protein
MADGAAAVSNAECMLFSVVEGNGAGNAGVENRRCRLFRFYNGLPCQTSTNGAGKTWPIGICVRHGPKPPPFPGASPPINLPLGLTVYFWHVQIDQFA